MFIVVAILMMIAPLRAAEPQVITSQSLFSKKAWLESRTGMVPIIVTTGINGNPSDAAAQLHRLLAEKTSRFCFTDMISDSEVMQKVTLTGKPALWKQISEDYLESREFDFSLLQVFGKAAGCRYLAIPTYDGDSFEGDAANGTYQVTLSVTLMDVEKGIPLTVACSTGESSNVTIKQKGQKTFQTTGASFASATWDAVTDIAIELNRNFIGDPVSGDCVNGIGIYQFYDPPNIHIATDKPQRRYEGSWQGGFAHGEGILYEHSGPRNNILMRMKGDWREGKLIRKGFWEYKSQGSWKRIFPGELERIRTGELQ